ncbi:hypothetical protein KC219_27575, partial [Mycobacterium tuberculosis]|nr:hypothetical protein [Mycobacterium tuberculosis]
VQMAKVATLFTRRNAEKMTQVLEDELNENRNLVWNKRVKARLILISSTNTNRESVAYRSFESVSLGDFLLTVTRHPRRK